MATELEIKLAKMVEDLMGELYDRLDAYSEEEIAENFPCLAKAQELVDTVLGR